MFNKWPDFEKARDDRIDALYAEIERLTARLLDAEMSLAVYDDGGSSEYWLRYPVRANQQTTEDWK